MLAVGAVHQHLIQNGLRMSASIVADTAQCFSTHQFACLIGYGARFSLFGLILNISKYVFVSLSKIMLCENFPTVLYAHTWHWRHVDNGA